VRVKILNYSPVFLSHHRPTLEEIRSWSKSFDKLMKSPGMFEWHNFVSQFHNHRIVLFLGGRKIFRDFLRCEYSEENILFWLACEELKQEKNSEAIEEKARYIYEDYISILSPKEVSLAEGCGWLVQLMVMLHPCIDWIFN
jgi:regulator of G-protein signaling